MVRIMQTILFAVRLAWPWVWRTFTATFWTVMTTVASIWVGVPTAVNTISEDWWKRAYDAGFPTEWERYLRFVLRALAYLTIVAGWIVLSFTTVFIVRLIF